MAWNTGSIFPSLVFQSTSCAIPGPRRKQINKQNKKKKQRTLNIMLYNFTVLTELGMSTNGSGFSSYSCPKPSSVFMSFHSPVGGVPTRLCTLRNDGCTAGVDKLVSCFSLKPGSGP